MKRIQPTSEIADYSGLDVHQFDKLVAERVFGWENCHGSYSTSDTSVRLVRNRVAELGLIGEFIDALYGMGAWCDWDFMQVTPRQQCEAAMNALDNTPPAMSNCLPEGATDDAVHHESD